MAVQFKSLQRHWTVSAKWCLVLALSLGLLTGPSGLGIGLLQAQDDAAEEAATEEAATEEGATEGEAAADPAAAPATPKSAGKSYLMWIVEASGVFGAIIVMESFCLVALITMNVMNFRRENFLPSDFVEQFEQKLQAKDYQGAFDLAKGNDSFLARVLAAGLGRLSRGYEDAVEGMQEVGDEEAMNLEHKLSYIGLVVATAPMLGLLGTVQGMIDSFRVIAESETSPKPKELALGIMTALVTTMEGLMVAIPAIFAFGLFKNKVARLTFEVGQMSETLMSRFSTVGKKAPAAGGAPATAPAPAAPASPAQ